MTSKKQIVFYLCFLGIVLALLAATIFIFNPFGILGETSVPEDENSARIPILMYHHFAESGAPGTVISAEMFERQISALRDAGYTAISFDELRSFVADGTPLPERPIVITIDDGYMSVYETAYPILRKYDMKATVFIIGVSHGKSLYKDTEHPIIPRFGDAEAAEMVESGVISIQSHSYDMHQHEPFETGPYRRGVQRRNDESEAEYIEAFKADYESAAAQIEAMLGTRPFVFSYPFGISNELTDGLLKDMGVEVTLTIKEGFNIVARDAPESLYSLKRFNVPGDRAPEELLRMLSP